MKIGFSKPSLRRSCWAVCTLLGGLLAGAGDAAAAPGLLHVGPFETIKSIQQAVGAIVAGGTIYVRDGTYCENILVDKPVTIRSEHGFEHTTVVAADPSAHVFEVTADNVTIEGFTVYGATESSQGIRLSATAESCTIADNRIGLDAGHTNRYGLFLHLGGGHVIRGNRCLYNLLGGIHLSGSDNNRIEGNTASHNESKGISLSNSTGNLILANHAFYGYSGIYVSGVSSISNRLIGNTCGYNTYGISLDSAGANLLTGNVVNLNDYGLFLRDTSGNRVWNNEFNANSHHGVYISDASGNSLYLNDLMSNTRSNVRSSGSVNFWTTPKPVIYLYEGGLPYSDKNPMGNFYNDHGLADLDTDGIADGVYALPGEEPDEAAPLTSERQYYNLDVHNRHPNDTVSALEDAAVLGSMTIFMDPADSAAAPVLVIEGKLTLGGF